MVDMNNQTSQLREEVAALKNQVNENNERISTEEYDIQQLKQTYKKGSHTPVTPQGSAHFCSIL